MDHSNLPDTTPSLMQRVRKGIFWMGVVTIGSKILSVGTTLILARVLLPEDFGLIGVASIVVSALAMFTDLGLGAAIIHSQAERRRMASTAFYIMPVIGLTLYLIAFFSAPALANLLGNPQAIDIIRIVAVNIVISSLTIVPSVLLEKDMAYKRKVIPDLGPIVVYIPVVLTLALVFNLGAYSIAYGLVVQALASLVLNWVAAQWRPHLIFDRHIALEMARYGKNVLGGNLIAYLTTNVDNAFISRILGATSLGHYTLAYSVTNIPATHIADVLGRVLFPSFVEIADDPVRLRKAYVRAITVLIIATFPLLLGLAAVAGPFVNLALGERWLSIIPVMQALVLFVLLRILSGPTGSLFLATGHSKIILQTGITGLLLQVPALYVALSTLDLGVIGAAWAIGLASLINGFVIAHFVNKIVPFKPIHLIEPALRLLTPSLAMAVVVAALALYLPVNPMTLIIEIILGAIVYLGLLVLLNGATIITDILTLIRRPTQMPQPKS